MRAPTFDGQNPTVHTVDNFMADFHTYVIAARILEADRLALFDTLIQRLAKRNYDAAIADQANPMNLPPALGANLAAAAEVADRAARLQARITWLTNEYQGLHQQQAMRTILRTLTQGIQE